MYDYIHENNVNNEYFSEFWFNGQFVPLCMISDLIHSGICRYIITGCLCVCTKGSRSVWSFLLWYQIWFTQVFVGINRQISRQTYCIFYIRRTSGLASGDFNFTRLLSKLGCRKLDNTFCLSACHGYFSPYFFYLL